MTMQISREIIHASSLSKHLLSQYIFHSQSQFRSYFSDSSSQRKDSITVSGHNHSVRSQSQRQVSITASGLYYSVRSISQLQISITASGHNHSVRSQSQRQVYITVADLSHSVRSISQLQISITASGLNHSCRSQSQRQVHITVAISITASGHILRVSFSPSQYCCEDWATPKPLPRRRRRGRAVWRRRPWRSG